MMRYPLTAQTDGYVDHYELTQSEADFADVLERRVEFISCEDRFTNSKFIEIFREIIKSMSGNAARQHHNNIREFLHNKNNLALLVCYRMLQVSAKRFNIKKNVALLEERNLFLNGRLFLRSRFDWVEMNNEMGVCCFNIFYYHDVLHPCTSINKWYGMCGVRILQLLESGQLLKEANTIYFLTQVLEYPEDVVVWNIDRLRAFGMIDSEDPFSSGVLHLRISVKGGAFLVNIFRNINYLYFFALDTLLPVGFISNELVDAHDNKFHKVSLFPSSAIKTSITFMLFLLLINKLENDTLQKNLDKRRYVQLEKLELPFQHKKHREKFLDNISTLVAVGDDKDLDLLNQYVSKLNSITSSSTPDATI